MEEQESSDLQEVKASVELLQEYGALKADILVLRISIGDNDDEVEKILADLEKFKKSKPFDWQIEMQERLRFLRQQREIEVAQLTALNTNAEALLQIILTTHPHLSSHMELEDIEGPSSLELGVTFKKTLVNAWVIGRISKEGEIINIVYGQFTRCALPPQDEWVFVGQNMKKNEEVKADDIVEADTADGRSNSDSTVRTNDSHCLYFDFTNETSMALLRQSVIDVAPMKQLDMSLKAKNVSQPQTKAYLVSNCAVDSLNGRYLQNGVFNEAPKYRNQNGWQMFRLLLQEIPSLGIYEDNCYEALRGPSMIQLLDEKSEIANMKLVDRFSTLEEGTVQFQRRFAELSRTGTRIVTMDQMLSNIHTETIRAHVRSDSDEAMLVMLRAMADAKYSADSGGNEQELSLLTQKLVAQDANIAGDDSTAGSLASDVSGIAMGTDIDIKVTLSRHIEYQSSSLGLRNEKSVGFRKKEAEGSSELLKAIEEREADLLDLKIAADSLQRAYISTSESTTEMSRDTMALGLADYIDRVRNSTIRVSEELGAWLRVCIQEKAKQPKVYYSADTTDPRSKREYCVAIAVRGSILYGQSAEVKSMSQMFRRGQQGAKYATDVKVVGCYKTRDEAAQAFSVALSGIPSEQVLMIDDNDKMFCGLRSCRKHYLMRSGLVPNDLPCEVCASAVHSVPNALVPSFAGARDAGPQFIWNGQNYLEKMWTDTSFLQENLFLKMSVPDIDFHHNPLLLSRPLLKSAFTTLNLTEDKTQLLNELKGGIEQLQEAKIAGTPAVIESEKQRKLGLPYREKLPTVASVTSTITPLGKSLTLKNGAATGALRSQTMNDGMLEKSFSMDSLFGNSVSFSRPNTAGSMFETIEFNDVERVVRALAILSQSASLSKEKLHQSSLPDVALSKTLPALMRPKTTKEVAQLTRKERRRAKLADAPEKVDAVYMHKGATIISSQIRPQVSHRKPDVFCRVDAGEFASLAKGRAMRSYMFQENLLQEGKRKVQERRLLQDALRKQLDVDIVFANVQQILSLIAKAKAVRGSVLDLDVVQAEQFLTYRKELIKSVLQMQSVRRGSVARKKFRKLKAEMMVKRKKTILTERFSYELARSFVPPLISIALETRVKQTTKAFFWTAANLSGMRCLVSVYQLARSSKKGWDLCPSCQYKSLSKSYSIVDKTSFVTMAPCTCIQSQSSEKWLIRGFDPLTRKQIDRILPTEEVRAIIQAAMTEPSLKTTKIRNLSKALLDVIENGIKFQLPFDYKCVIGPRTETNIDELERSVNAEWAWEPLANHRKAIHQLEYSRVQLQHLNTVGKSTFSSFSVVENEYFNYMETCYEWACMELEDSRGLLHRIDCRLKEAQDKIQAAMQFSKQSFEDFLAHERNDKVDRAQSWDNLENGHGWAGLNQQRKIEKIRPNFVLAYQDKCRVFANVTGISQELSTRVQAARDGASFASKLLSDFHKKTGNLLQMTEEAGRIAREGFKSLVSTLSLPLRNRPAPRRRLQVIPRYHKVTDPLQRTRKECRSNWEGLFRKIMTIRPEHQYSQKGPSFRCVVEIFRDPVTGFYLLQLGQSDYNQPTEEGAQHLDIAVSKSEFSSYTLLCSDSDVVLSPADVENILKREPFWPLKERLPRNSIRYKSQSLATTSERSSIEDEAFGQKPPLIPTAKRDGANLVFPPRYSSSVCSVSTYSSRWSPGCRTEEPTTFQKRKAKEDKLKHDTAIRLSTYFRLQEHTHRPCLGLIHFERRIAYSSKNISRCLWYRDLRMGQSASWSNEVYKAFQEISMHPVKSSMQLFLRNVEVRLVSNNKDCGIIIPIDYIFSRMAERPMLLMSFLAEVILNQHSTDTMKFILSQLDLQLPGEENCGGRWRSPFLNEIPAVKFLPVETDRYRGPPFCVHRFIGGKYFQARFTTSASDDLSIELRKPIDGNFWAHMYMGDTIRVLLSRDELRAFVANASYVEGLVPNRLVGSVELLRPENRSELYALLLDTIIVHPEIILNGKVENWERDGRHLQYFTQISKCMQKLWAKFDSWAGRSFGRIAPMTESTVETALTSLPAVTVEPQWKLNLAKDRQSGKLVEVHSGVWSAVDAEYYYGKKGDGKYWHHRRISMASASSEDAVEDDPFNTPPESYWAVRMLTNEAKAAFYFEMKPASGSDNYLVQKFLAKRELQKMYLEEESSRRFHAFDRLQLLQRQKSEKIRLQRTYINTTAIPAVNTQQINQMKAEMILDGLLESCHEHFKTAPLSVGLKKLQILESFLRTPSSARDSLFAGGEFVTLKQQYFHKALSTSKWNRKVVPQSLLSDFMLLSDLSSTTLVDCEEYLCIHLEPFAPSFSGSLLFGGVDHFEASRLFRESRCWQRANYPSKRNRATVFRVADGLFAVTTARVELMDIPVVVIYDCINSKYYKATMYSTEEELKKSEFDTAASDQMAKRVAWQATKMGIANVLGRRVKHAMEMATSDATAFVADSLKDVQHMEDELRLIKKKMDQLSVDAELPSTDVKSITFQGATVDNEEFPPDSRHSLQTWSPSTAMNREGHRIYVMVIPWDESVPYTSIESNSTEWNTMIKKFVCLDSKRQYKRTHTLSGIVISSTKNCSDVDQHLENTRMNRWIMEYMEFFGWRNSSEERQYLHKLHDTDRAVYAPGIPVINGDALLLLRFGNKDHETLINWLEERKKEYIAIIEMQQRKLEVQRRSRVSNHQKFRERVFDVAKSFLNCFENLFQVNYDRQKHVREMHSFEATPLHCRVLLSRFCELRQYFDKLDVPVEDKLASLPTLDEGFLIDSEFVTSDEKTLYRFESLPEEDAHADFMAALSRDLSHLEQKVVRYSVDPEIEKRQKILRRAKLLDLQPRVGQVIYALFQLHCWNCSIVGRTCRFPGCSQIHEEARCHVISNDEELRGTGQHPIDIAIKRFILTDTEILYQHLPAQFHPTMSPNFDPDAEAEREWNICVEKIKEDAKYQDWKSLREDARQFRYLHRRLPRLEIASASSPSQIVSAHPGKFAEFDESFLSEERKIEADKILSELYQIEEKKLLFTNSIQQEASSSDDKADIDLSSSELFVVPREIVLQMLAKERGIDCSGNAIPFRSIDPYPAARTDAFGGIIANVSKHTYHYDNEADEEEEEIIRPMSSNMCSWLVNKLQLARPKRVPSNISGDRGQLVTAKAALKFDRLHYECACVLHDGTLATIQFLHGVLSGLSLSNDEMSGCPHGAMRFCPTHLLPILVQGITILVYDTKCRVSVACPVHERVLSRTASAFKVQESDIPSIITKLAALSSRILRLGRVGSRTTSVTLDLNCIQDPQKQLAKANDAVKVTAVGRRQTVIDKRANILASAKRFSNAFK